MNNTLMNEFVSLFQKMMEEASKNTSPLVNHNKESQGSDILTGNTNNPSVSNLTASMPDIQSGINFIPIIKKDAPKETPVKVQVAPKSEVPELFIQPPLLPKPDEIFNKNVLDTKSKLADVLLQKLGFSDTSVESLVKQNKVDKVLEKADKLYIKPEVIIHAHDKEGSSLFRYLYEYDDDKVNEVITYVITCMLNLDEDDEIPSWVIKPVDHSNNLSIVKVGGVTIYITYMESRYGM